MRATSLASAGYDGREMERSTMCIYRGSDRIISPSDALDILVVYEHTAVLEQ